MKLAFVYLAGRLKRTSSSLGATPSDFFLGARELEQRGHSVAMYEAQDSTQPGLLEIALRLCLGHALLPPKTYVGLFAGLRPLALQLRTADVVVATSSGLAFVLAFWRWWYRLPFQLVGIQTGILHFQLSRMNELTAKWLLPKMYTQVFAVPEMEAMRTRFRVPPAQIEANPFGVDTAFWTPGNRRAEPPYVLAIGNDAQRDWNTLLEAARGAPWRLVLVTRRPLPDPLPPNVEWRRGSYATAELSDLELRDLYRSATCVVVPLRPVLQPSGQSVSLQAMACGTPVVLTRTPGLWDIDGLRDGEHIRLVEPADPLRLREAITGLVQDAGTHRKLAAASRPYVLARGDIARFASRLEALCARIATPAPPEAMEGNL